MAAFALLVPVAAHARDAYVAPNGNDTSADGSATMPFASLSRARDELRKAGPAGSTVHVRGGIYRLAEPFILTPADSGSEAAPVVYAAAEGETPVFSGGVAISGWKVDAKGRWVTTLPAVGRGEWDFAQLFVNGVRRFRPRSPSTGFHKVAAELPSTPAMEKEGYDRFAFAGGDIKSSFKNLGDVEALCFSNWQVSRLRIASVDDAAKAVTFTGPTGSRNDFSRIKAGSRYILDNVAEALDEPGEWYLDRKSGELTYSPMPGETIEKTEVVAPRLERLLDVRGDAAKRQFVHDVVFRGLSFEHANRVTPAKGHNDVQAEMRVRGAVYAEGARRVAWERCRIEHVGTYGLDLAVGCQDNRVEQCVLSDLGAGGLRIGETSISPDLEARVARNRVENNLILHGGRTLPGGIGLFVLQSSDNVVRHNEIGDFYYTGISSGWTWGYEQGLATGNLYEANYVHDIGQGLLSDMAGIYTLGDHTGSVIRGNRFENVECLVYGGWGIYFDEGTTGAVAEQNWVRGTTTGGFHQHYGKNNVVRNNVFVDGRQQWLERTRVEPAHQSFAFERNVVIGREPTVLKGDWKSNVAVDHNVYWRPGGKADFGGGRDLAARQAADKQDLHSLNADPGIGDLAGGDFRPAAGSAAEKVGFKAFDASKAGVTGEMKKLKRPEAPAGFPVTPAGR